MGFPVTKANLRFLSSWQAQEGGATHNSATFNWFNTTRGSQFPSINSVGVRAYPSFNAGITETAATLNNGNYNDILAGLKAGNPYKAPVRDDLSTWVSGSPTKGLSYASRVLGSSAPAVSQPRAVAKAVAAGKTRPAQTQTGDLTAARSALMSYFIASNNALMSGETPPDFTPYGVLARNLAAEARQTASKRIATPTTVSRTPQSHEAAKSHTTTAQGFLQAPTSWQGTHVTDGLGWGTKTAEDIMAAPGTAVGAPEDGVIEYFHPTGAQGGGSMLLRTDSGKEYWLGHIANGLPHGSRVKRGQQIAVISADHPRPHLHIDERAT
jgi:Peptidase family M23.